MSPRVHASLEMKSEPPLAELAARLPDERWPMLLDGAGDEQRYGCWRMLVFDPLERIEDEHAPAAVALLVAGAARAARVSEAGSRDGGALARREARQRAR